MFRLSNSLIGVKNYYISNDNLLQVSSANDQGVTFTYFDSASLNILWKVVIELEAMYILFESEKYFIGYVPNHVIFTIHKQSGKLHLENCKFIPEVQVGESLYGRYTDESGVKSIAHFTPNSFEFKPLIHGQYKVIAGSSDELILISPGQGSRIYCFSLSTKKITWETDINNPFNGNIIFHKDNVVIGTSGQKFVALNKAKGEIVWQIDAVPYLKIFNDLLYGLNAVEYVEVSPLNGDVIRHISLKDSYNMLDIQNSAASYTVDDVYIYFNDVTKAKIGILEKATGKIVWTFKLPVKDGVTIPSKNIPQVHSDKLYVLDSEDTLYIFDRL